MKKTFIAIIIFLIIPFVTVCAQIQPVSSLLNRFSPLAEIIIRSLGMEDKNGNGMIDMGLDEGYEEFIQKYGTGGTLVEKQKSVDCGFHANRVMIGANNNRLEENEIVNYYYINIRFKPEFNRETDTIEGEIAAFIRANNLPLIWLDDEQGTVMNAVTRILGAGWNDPTAQRTEDEAVRLFTRALNGMNVRGRTGLPSNNGGYYTMPEMVTRRAGYCFEIAQFGHWFFSQLRINSVSVNADLTVSILHEVVRFASGRRVDFFGSSNRYNVSADNWHISNPLQSIGTYYLIKGNVSENRSIFEQAVLYDKYEISNTGRLMNNYFNNSARYHAASIINLGIFLLNNNDVSMLLNTRQLNSSMVRDQVKSILLMMLVSYNLTSSKSGCDHIAGLLETHYANDMTVKEYLYNYRL